MNTDHLINIVPFTILREKVAVSFSVTEKAGYQRIYKGNLPSIFPQSVLETIDKFAWWTHGTHEGDVGFPADLILNIQFAKHYLNSIIYLHFFNNNFLINQNFIGDTVVLIEDGVSKVKDCQKFNQFSLRVDKNNLMQGLGLLVSYDKSPDIFSKSLQELGLPEHVLGKVKYKNKIFRYSDLNEDQKEEKNEIYPILNRQIRISLGIPFEWNYSENKYKNYYNNISNFYERLLKDLEIDGTIKIFSSGFQRISDENISHTTDDSNKLIFGNNQKNFVPYIGIKEFGPATPVVGEKIKFFFIFHQDDKEYANKLFSYLKKGYKSFPGLLSFVKLDFDLEEGKTIRFTHNDPIPEIQTQLNSFEFDPSVKYAAIYISRIKKNSDDENEDAYYFRLKELLLGKDITSQVIYKENIYSPAFNFFLPNISIALLAKLGGIPWRLFRPVKNDLVIGIGADRTLSARKRFVGSAFCFKNDGSFQGFDAFEERDVGALVELIEKAVGQYIAANADFDRVVIHYYKSMKGSDERRIRTALQDMKTSVPLVILSINETYSKDYVFFDKHYDGKMPQSGTFVKVNFNEFLLCNNTRYSSQTGTRIDGFPFPIKIKIKSTGYEKINDMSVVQDLVDQVYQFSRMYWKSVRQRNMPVTVEYSKIIAKTISHFENKHLGEFARSTLWFL